MTGTQLLRQNPNPTDREIRRALAGNLCRCTGYVNIVRAVKTAAETMRSRAPEPALSDRDGTAATSEVQ